MSSFKGAYSYRVVVSGDSCVIDADPTDASYLTLYKDRYPDGVVFKVGDRITIAVDGGEQEVYDYIGSYDGGVLASEGGAYAYLITDKLYPVGTTFQLNTEPFPVCFVKGTLITTPRGPVAIEELLAGDVVKGSSGWRTVKWIGWRNYGPASFVSQEGKSRIAPIRIRAHAIADNVPSSDLLVSAWHHLVVEGKLVRAGDLVNGTTIVQETHVTDVAYYHVELDQFDVIMAHGIYSESWADGGNRDFFQNVDITSLRPEDMERRRAPRPGFDHLVLHKGKELAAIQSRVAQRAKTLPGTEVNVREVA